MPLSDKRKDKNMKLKRMAFILSLVMAASMMTACGNAESDDEEDTEDVVSVAEDEDIDDEDTEESADESTEADVSDDAAAESSEALSSADESSAVDDSAAAAAALEEMLTSAVNDSVELSENLYDFEVAIDGVKYTFPIDYATLNSNGWEFEGDIEQGIPKDNYLLAANYYKGDSYIGANPANFVSESDVAVKDSITYQGYFKIDDDYHQTRSAVMFPKGIKLGVSTVDEVKAAYGEPTEEEAEDSYGKRKLNYQEGYMVYWNFRFDAETDVLVSAQLCNMKDVVS